MSSTNTYQARIYAIHRELNIPEDYAQRRNINMQIEAHETTLCDCGQDRNGKTHRLTTDTARHWKQMQSTAQNNGVVLMIDSGFRSVDYQRSLIEKKLAQGTSLPDILKILAAPGYSEHHTGRAIDVGTLGIRPCAQDFENTDAFKWLTQHAQQYGFSMSYPRDNPQGFIYEPWHWALVQ